jgi:hypothetical protein
MATKNEKRKWHSENRPYVFEHFKGICQFCNSQINKHQSYWDIHHLTYHYNKPLYETEANELIENKIITLICRPCHNIEHTAKDPQNPQHLENQYYCEKCGRLERGILQRKKLQNLEMILCRKCFLTKDSDKNQIKLF